MRHICVPALLALGGCGGDLIPIGTHWTTALAAAAAAVLVARVIAYHREQERLRARVLAARLLAPR